MQRNNKFGAKNINLATTIGGEKKLLVKIFIWRWNVISRKSLTCVVHVYLNCQLLTSHNSVADGVKPEHASCTSDICHVVTACIGLNQKLLHHTCMSLKPLFDLAMCEVFSKMFYLFVLFDSLQPINNLSVKQGQFFLG